MSDIRRYRKMHPAHNWDLDPWGLSTKEGPSAVTVTVALAVHADGSVGGCGSRDKAVEKVQAACAAALASPPEAVVGPTGAPIAAVYSVRVLLPR